MSDEATPPVEPTPEAPAPTPRYVWGPDLAEPHTLAAAPDAKADVELVFVDVDPATGHVTLQVPAHDPATHLVPARVHLLDYEPGHAIHGSAADAVAAAAGGTPISSVADVTVTDPAAATEVVLSRPEAMVPGVAYTGKTVLEFHA